MFSACGGGLHLLHGQFRQHALPRQCKGRRTSHFLKRASEVSLFALLTAVLEHVEDPGLALFPGADLGEGGGGVAADLFLGIVEQGHQPGAHGLLLIGGAEASEDHPRRADHGDPLHALAG